MKLFKLPFIMLFAIIIALATSGVESDDDVRFMGSRWGIHGIKQPFHTTYS